MGTTITLGEIQAFDPQVSLRNDGITRYCCPFCGASKTKDAAHRSFCLNAMEGVFICHRCGARGRLGQDVGFRRKLIELARTPRRPRVSWRRVLAKCLMQPIQGTPGEAYLVKRGLSREVIGRAGEDGLRFCGSFYRRAAVVFDIRGECGEVVAVQGRFLDRADPRMMTLGPKSLGLYMTPGAWDGDLCVTEAPIDALSLFQMGVPAMATCGSGLPLWLPTAAKGRTVWIATDADRQGDEYHELWKEQFLQQGARVERLRPPTEGGDWNDQLRGA